jgi:hypothetical protein
MVFPCGEEGCSQTSGIWKDFLRVILVLTFEKIDWIK